MSSAYKGALIALAGLPVLIVVLLVVLGVAVELTDDQPDSPAPTRTVTAQGPIVTPTEVSVPPPVTPAAVSTRPPISDGQCPTADELAYLLELSQLLQSIGDASTELEQSMQAPDLTTSLEAQRLVVIWAAGIALVADKILALTPPSARLTNLDQAASRLARAWRSSMEILAEFLDQPSESLLQQASAHIDTALASAQEIRRLRDEICA